MTFWIKLGLVVALALALLSAKARYDNGIRAEVRAQEVAPLKAAWEKDKAERLHAYAKLMTDYVSVSQEAERLQKERDDALHQMQQERHARVAAIPRGVADVRVPVVAGVLNAGNESSGSGSPTTATGKIQQDSTAGPGAANSGDTTVGLWAEWSATMKDLYESCRSQVMGYVDYYNGLRAKQLKGIQP